MVLPLIFHEVGCWPSCLLHDWLQQLWFYVGCIKLHHNVELISETHNSVLIRITNLIFILLILFSWSATSFSPVRSTHHRMAR